MNTKVRSQPRQSGIMNGFFPAITYSAIADLRRIREHLQRSEDFLRSEVGRFKSEVALEVQRLGLSREAADDFYDANADEYEALTGFLPSALRQSIVLLACSVLESRMTDAAKELDVHPEIPKIRRWTQKGKKSGFFRAADFLRDNIGVDATLHPSWRRLAAWYELRNCIAHAGGVVMLMATPGSIKSNVATLRSQGVAIVNGTIHLPEGSLVALLDDMLAFAEALSSAFVENELVGPLYWP